MIPPSQHKTVPGYSQFLLASNLDRMLKMTCLHCTTLGSESPLGVILLSYFSTPGGHLAMSEGIFSCCVWKVAAGIYKVDSRGTGKHPAQEFPVYVYTQNDLDQSVTTAEVESWTSLGSLMENLKALSQNQQKFCSLNIEHLVLGSSVTFSYDLSFLII